MWRAYIGYVGTAVAIINSLLAIIIALLPVRRSVAKLRFAVMALILAGLAVSAGFYGRYQARVQAEQQQVARNQTREQLETFILEGRTLLGQIKDAQRELPTRPADEWAQRTEIYLRDKLGERYVARFRKDVNDLYGEPSLPPSRMGYWRAVRNRVVNLEMINADFPEQPPAVRNDRS